MTRAHNKAIRLLVRTSLGALGRFTPGSNRMTTAGSAAFTAAVRVIDRVHGNAAADRSDTQPTRTAGFAERSVLVIRIGNGADRSQTLFAYDSQFARAELQLGITGILTDNLGIATGRTDQLPAFAGFKLNVVNNRTDRHVLQRHSITRFNVRLVGRNNLVAGFQSLRSQNIGLFAVLIAD